MGDGVFVVLLAVGALVCFGGTGLVLRAARRNRAEAAASLAWPTVPGHVTASRVTEGTRRHENNSWTVYNPEVAYDYVVDGRAYTGNEIRIGGWSGLGSEAKAEAVLAPYPVGAAVPVFYDPDRPSRAVLVPGGGGASWQLFASAAMFGLLGLAGIAGIVAVLIAG